MTDAGQEAIRAAYEAIRAPRMETTQVAPTVLYRIIHGPTALPTDFMTNLAKCLQMRGPELNYPLIWAGLSMYDTPETAAQTARRYRGKIGTFLAELHLHGNTDHRVAIAPSLGPGHFTVLCCDRTCLSFVRDVRPIVGLPT